MRNRRWPTSLTVSNLEHMQTQVSLDTRGGGGKHSVKREAITLLKSLAEISTRNRN